MLHDLEAIAGVGGIERYVRRPALHDADEAGDERNGTIDAQADSIARAHTTADEIGRHPIGQLVELAVSEAPIGVAAPQVRPGRAAPPTRAIP